mmetsp:Transcript_11529/g.30456  ORF Transcript_11529/g.30456 Transcript_11529/m.30456 type:complete len:305 (+) Transcript_11529:486-1400(+)
MEEGEEELGQEAGQGHQRRLAHVEQPEARGLEEEVVQAAVAHAARPDALPRGGALETQHLLQEPKPRVPVGVQRRRAVDAPREGVLHPGPPVQDAAQQLGRDSLAVHQDQRLPAQLAGSKSLADVAKLPEAAPRGIEILIDCEAQVGVAGGRQHLLGASPHPVELLLGLRVEAPLLRERQLPQVLDDHQVFADQLPQQLAAKLVSHEELAASDGRLPTDCLLRQGELPLVLPLQLYQLLAEPLQVAEVTPRSAAAHLLLRHQVGPDVLLGLQHDLEPAINKAHDLRLVAARGLPAEPDRFVHFA